MFLVFLFCSKVVQSTHSCAAWRSVHARPDASSAGLAAPSRGSAGLGSLYPILGRCAPLTSKSSDINHPGEIQRNPPRNPANGHSRTRGSWAVPTPTALFEYAQTLSWAAFAVSVPWKLPKSLSVNYRSSTGGKAKQEL